MTDDELATLKRLAHRLPEILDELEQARQERAARTDEKPSAKRAAYYEDRLAVAQGRKLVWLDCAACEFNGWSRAKSHGVGQVETRCPSCERYRDLGPLEDAKLADA